MYFWDGVSLGKADWATNPTVSSESTPLGPLVVKQVRICSVIY